MAQVDSNPAYAAVLKRIVDKLAGKGKTQKCAMCGVNSWVVGQYVTLQTSQEVPVLPNPYAFRPSTSNYPTVAVFCSNCGNTQFVNLLILGFTEQELRSLTFPPVQ